MKLTIFTYNREKMLKAMVKEVPKGIDITIHDDGSNWDVHSLRLKGCYTFAYQHTGKREFWLKWKTSIASCCLSHRTWFVFLPDDLTNVNWDAIKELTEQDWDDKLVAINLTNSGLRYRWGHYDSGQPDFTINDMLYQECGYVDGCFVTNRKTLSQLTIDPVPDSWFNRPDKSSGVGHQISMKFRKLGVKMMLPEFSLCYHGDHESVMHPEHRKEVPLISKMKP